MNSYIGTKKIEACPEDKNGEKGYKVVYEDGYESWSPKKTFEQAYENLSDGVDFGHALYFVKKGARAERRGWNGKHMFIELREHPYLVVNEFDTKTSSLFIQMRTADGNYIPWVASQTDLLANDWIVEERADPDPDCAVNECYPG